MEILQDTYAYLVGVQLHPIIIIMLFGLIWLGRAFWAKEDDTKSLIVWIVATAFGMISQSAMYDFRSGHDIARGCVFAVAMSVSAFGAQSVLSKIPWVVMAQDGIQAWWNKKKQDKGLNP